MERKKIPLLQLCVIDREQVMEYRGGKKLHLIPVCKARH